MLGIVSVQPGTPIHFMNKCMTERERAGARERESARERDRESARERDQESARERGSERASMFVFVSICECLCVCGCLCACKFPQAHEPKEGDKLGAACERLEHGVSIARVADVPKPFGERRCGEHTTTRLQVRAA